eukprot:1248476-Rhodomonas_salina.2
MQNVAPPSATDLDLVQNLETHTMSPKRKVSWLEFAVRPPHLGGGFQNGDFQRSTQLGGCARCLYCCDHHVPCQYRTSSSAQTSEALLGTCHKPSRTSPHHPKALPRAGIFRQAGYMHVPGIAVGSSTGWDNRER